MKKPPKPPERIPSLGICSGVVGMLELTYKPLALVTTS